MRKYFIKVCIFFVIAICILENRIVFASLPLTGKLIVLDVGHGGLDPGTMFGNIYEKDINLAISLELEKELSRLGASVILIRNDDYDLSKPNATWRKKSDFDNRIKIINTSNADYYLSIHLNYLNDSSYYGPQVFYNTKSEKNKIIAQSIQKELNRDLNTKREIKLIPNTTYMYKELKVEGVLIECGFLSNPYERSLLVKEEYQKKLAKSIAKGMSKLKF